MIFPESIAKLVGNSDYTTDNIGLSDSTVLHFGDCFLKIEPTGANADNEQIMTAWLSGKIPVPEILAFERQDGYNYLLTAAVPGRMLCSADLLSDGDRLLKLLAEAFDILRSVDVSDCPVSASVEHKLRLAEQRVAGGLCSTEDAEPDTYGPGGFRSPEHLLRWLTDNRPEESLQLTHGDFCLPNIFTDGRHITGFIDLGRSGAADMYVDLALSVRSLRHNLDGTYSSVSYPSVDPRRLYSLLGISPDEDLMRYYLLLDELF